MQIIIRTLTGKTHYLEVKPTYTVKKLKEIYKDIDGTPHCQQRFIYAGDQLEDKRTLDYYGIHDNSELHLVLRLRGGGPGFAFSDIENIQQHNYSKTAPDYRMAGKGLNLELYCDQVEDYIIVPKGFGKFNCVSFNKEKCSVCEKLHDIALCGFSKCEYRFSGIRDDGCVAKVSNIADKKYIRTSESKVMWKSLAVIVTPLPKTKE